MGTRPALSGTEVGAAFGFVVPLLDAEEAGKLGDAGAGSAGSTLRGEAPDAAGAEVGLGGQDVPGQLVLVGLGVGPAPRKGRTPRWRRGPRGSSGAASRQAGRSAAPPRSRWRSRRRRRGRRCRGPTSRGGSRGGRSPPASRGRGCRRRRSPSPRPAAARPELQSEGHRLARGDLRRPAGRRPGLDRAAAGIFAARRPHSAWPRCAGCGCCPSRSERMSTATAPSFAAARGARRRARHRPAVARTVPGAPHAGRCRRRSCL